MEARERGGRTRENTDQEDKAGRSSTATNNRRNVEMVASSVVLVSGEGERFTVDKKIAERSLLLKNYLNDMHDSNLQNNSDSDSESESEANHKSKDNNNNNDDDEDDDEDEIVMPVPNVRSSVLRRLSSGQNTQGLQFPRRRRRRFQKERARGLMGQGVFESGPRDAVRNHPGGKLP